MSRAIPIRMDDQFIINTAMIALILDMRLRSFIIRRFREHTEQEHMLSTDQCKEFDRYVRAEIDKCLHKKKEALDSFRKDFDVRFAKEMASYDGKLELLDEICDYFHSMNWWEESAK